MACINFVIPSNRSELLKDNDSNYFVKDVIIPRNLVPELKNAKIRLRDEGVEYILQKFDVYYSVLQHGDTIQSSILMDSYQDLHRAMGELNKTIGFLLEDKESLSENEELKDKYCTIIKMLVYIYTQTVTFIEGKIVMKNQRLLKKKRPSKSDEEFNIDKKNVLLMLNNIIQRDIREFWDPPIVEESLINAVSEICYRLLENPTIKSEKDVQEEIFNLIGTLIKHYNHGTTFVIHTVQLIKVCEHLVQCLPQGIQFLVETYNFKGVVHELIREITEWQTDEKYEDSQGSRYCASVLSGMAGLMPDLMIPELLYLNKYLNHESVPLRNSVLTVITEVIMNVLAKCDLNEEQMESRDEFFSILMDHMNDVAALVRSKVMQHMARLQKENAIPMKLINIILERVIDHLEDKGAMVRKASVHCITTFLLHNPYGSNLSLKSMEQELEAQKKLLDSAKAQLDDVKEAITQEKLTEWLAIKDDLKKTIEEELEKEKDEENEKSNEEEDDEDEIPETEIVELIQLYLSERKFKEAFVLCKKASKSIEEFQQFRENNAPHEAEIYMVPLQSIFINIRKILKDLMMGILAKGARLTEEDLQNMEALQNKVIFLTDAVTFLKLIDGVMAPMTELLETTAVSDMHEAVEFFTSVYHFNIDNASVGIIAMLRIMQRNEQERKDYIINAFKKIYLNSDSRNMVEHTSIIVNRLVGLVKTVPICNVDDLEQIISEWIVKGLLDNSVIDRLWQFFTKKVDVSDEDSHAAVELLRMAALGRRSIVTKNVKLIATLAFSERGENNMVFLGSCCELLAIAGRDRIDINSKNLPFKINPDDTIFEDLTKILYDKFLEPVDYYNKALFGGITFIYKLCSKPEKICEEFLTKILEKLSEYIEGTEEKVVDNFILIRICQLLGFIAIKHTEYLDDVVYKELKRRNNIREELKKSHKTGKQKNKRNVRMSAIMNESLLNSSLADESILEGAQAEDQDAEFILNVLENDTVSGSGGLGKLAYIVTGICERPDIYDDVMLQGAAVIALMRYMLVSSKFCGDHIQLLFTIFAKTNHPEIKCSILVHLSDLLTRFPNIVEPWTPEIYTRLKDPLESVRKATFFTLSNLILRDMVRAHSHISEMVCCLLDENPEMAGMCKTFLVSLSHKENSLYNVLPDIFSHLMEVENTLEEDIRNIMKFLFDLMDKSKHMENLVDRFCLKFRVTDDIKHHRNIAYCLTLIQYNERALNKLQENFQMYKHLVHDSEIYASFKTIMQNCNKQQVGKADLRPAAAEIEKLINSVFELNEDGNAVRPSAPPKSARKTSKRKTRRTKKRSKADSDSDEDYE